MPLLQLKNIGKIYVSEGNVAVGIRGVNLSFNRGEFVAITGKSGSGKSTLLNVISGMDTYEEGEMLIEGHTTSHYLQPEWEDYREKYISFIFQDYNIIESFTVLQNVELALMHIKNERERRERAVTLLKRVGLGDRINQKGSKLSGGQKQRTVIARALAKDSPIILADEPTGNLDSKTSEEIISLLREVAKDKLLIMVTHNFDQVEHFATRHIRVFDGAIESDHVLIPAASIEECNKVATEENTGIAPKKSKCKTYFETLKNGLHLGKTIFTSTPKLSTFLCLLLIVGILSIFAITSFCATDWREYKTYMFTHVNGRVVITKSEGGVIGEQTVKELAQKYGAKDYVTCDYLFEQTQNYTFRVGNKFYSVDFDYTYDEYYGNNIIGRYPQSEGEVFLYLPIYLKPVLGDSIDSMKQSISIVKENYVFKISGIKYFIDNTQNAKILLTRKGFSLVTGFYAKTLKNASYSVNVTLNSGDKVLNRTFTDIIPSPFVETGKIYIPSLANSQDYADLQSTVTVQAKYGSDKNIYNYEKVWGNVITTDGPAVIKSDIPINNYYYDNIVSDDSILQDNYVYVSPELYREMNEKILSDTYTQASLIFNNDSEAHYVVNRLKDDGYLSVTSDSVVSDDGYDYIIKLLSNFFVAVLWCVVVLFLALFVNLCTRRTIGTFKSDMAIMRSMGIPVHVIRIAMYVRMLVALIPAFISLVILALILYLNPVTNGIFTFLHAWQYICIVIGIIALTFMVTHSQVRRLFKQSVKKSLKGGATE